MGQLKYYNESTGEWEPTVAGAQGPQGEQGADGYVGADGLPGIVAQAGQPSSTDILWLDTDEAGVGIPLGGASGQVLSKIDSGDFNTEWTTPYTAIDAADDIASAIATKSDTSHTHDDRYYTESETDNAISVAISNVVDTAPALLDTLNELSASLNDDPNFATTVANALAALVPAGTINQTARSSAPTGYLLCDGSAISRTTYSALFSAIGTAYGAGDNSTTFNIPNLKGKVPVGYDPAQSEFDTLGETGGAKTHTLSSSEIPSHTHSGSTSGQSNGHTHGFSATTSTGGAHTHPLTGSNGGSGGISMAVTGNTNNDLAYGPMNGAIATSSGSHNHTVSGTTGDTSGNHTHSFTTDGGTGGGAAHNNLQPYVVLNYMIKI